MDRVCGLAIRLLINFRLFYHRKTEKGKKPKTGAVNFILFDNTDFF